MSVMLSAASCLDWAAKLTGMADVPALIAAAQQADENAGTVWFLPYLSGERTPHNNPEAKGVFFGLTHQHGPAELARAVLEGVGYALADGMDVVHDCGLKPASVTLIGGGARSPYWRQMLSDISGLQLDFRTGGDVGPALGAARLAALSEEPASALRARVTSKGGTTEAALQVMTERGLKDAIVAGVKAANARGAELGELLGKD